MGSKVRSAKTTKKRQMQQSLRDLKTTMMMNMMDANFALSSLQEFLCKKQKRRGCTQQERLSKNIKHTTRS